MTILELHKRFNKWDSARVFVSIVSQTDETIVELNKDQLNSGFNSKKQRLKLYASLRYALRKNAMNSKPGLWNPDLKVSGKFQDKIKAKPTRIRIRVESTDSKAKHLEEKYSSDIYGLSDENLNEYIEKKFYLILMKAIRTLFR